MNYFPLFFDLRGLRVLVVGAGAVALRKVQLLERAHAAIVVVAPQMAADIERRAAAGTIELRVREFCAEDLDGARLVIVATARRALNRWIASLAEARGIPVNVVDDLKASRVIVPAIIDRDPVIVAVSSAGTSPVLARRLRERLESLVPQRIGPWAAWLAGMRAVARRRIPGADARRRYFEMLVDGPAERRFVAGDERGARQIAQRLLAAVAAPAAPTQAGEVTLVGAGPGDPELLTLKALRALQDADVILHDRLVPAAVLDYARRDAEKICVGKSAGGGGASQEAINDLLIAHARRGRRVVRLKGGDPFIFGRGGEELEALARAGVAFSVVPGISAANGCAAYAGIPLTHRDHAHSVSFVTGHAGEAGDEPDWASLARPRSTAVFYMGLARLEHILARLIEHGAPCARPAALIVRGTTADQQVIVATLGTLRGTVTARRLESPALLVVGEVASLHDALAWFGTSPAAKSEPRSA